MAINDRLSRHDTWSELERAAISRYWDGLALALGEAGHRTGAIYLLGYVAEMLIKTAYYRVRCIDALVNLQDELRGMPARASFLGLSWRGNKHNLESLCRLQVEERRARGQAMQPDLSVPLQRRIAVITRNWTETLRYKY